MMEAVRTSESSVDNYFTRQYIPEDNSEQILIYLYTVDWFTATNLAIIINIITGGIGLARFVETFLCY
jgi:hypothetical protein